MQTTQPDTENRIKEKGRKNANSLMNEYTRREILPQSNKTSCNEDLRIETENLFNTMKTGGEQSMRQKYENLFQKPYRSQQISHVIERKIQEEIPMGKDIENGIDTFSYANIRNTSDAFGKKKESKNKSPRYESIIENLRNKCRSVKNCNFKEENIGNFFSAEGDPRSSFEEKTEDLLYLINNNDLMEQKKNDKINSNLDTLFHQEILNQQKNKKVNRCSEINDEIEENLTIVRDAQSISKGTKEKFHQKDENLSNQKDIFSKGINKSLRIDNITSSDKPFNHIDIYTNKINQTNRVRQSTKKLPKKSSDSISKKNYLEK